MRIAARAADGGTPGFIAQTDPEGGALGAERTVAEIADGRSHERAAIGKYRYRQQPPGEKLRVVHQVASDHAARIGDAVGGSVPILLT